MVYRNARGHRQAWKLLHTQADMTNADIADAVGIPLAEVEQLRAEHIQRGAAATGDWFTDQSIPTVTGRWPEEAPEA